MYYKKPRSKKTLTFTANAYSGEREYKTEEDIWKELIWFVDNEYPKLKRERNRAIKAANKKAIKKPETEIPKSISIGQDLWTNQFCHSKYIVDEWMYDIIEEVLLSLSANIPIAPNVQDCDILAADYYSIIQEELIAVEAF